MTLPEYIKFLNLSPEEIDEMPPERMINILKVVVAMVEEEKPPCCRSGKEKL